MEMVQTYALTSTCDGGEKTDEGVSVLKRRITEPSPVKEDFNTTRPGPGVSDESVAGRFLLHVEETIAACQWGATRIQPGARTPGRKKTQEIDSEIAYRCRSFNGNLEKKKE